jgi:hypothetical protein
LCQRISRTITRKPARCVDTEPSALSLWAACLRGVCTHGCKASGYAIILADAVRQREFVCAVHRLCEWSELREPRCGRSRDLALPNQHRPPRNAGKCRTIYVASLRLLWRENDTEKGADCCEGRTISCGPNGGRVYSMRTLHRG